MKHRPGKIGYAPLPEHWVEVKGEHTFPHSELALHCRFAGRKIAAVIMAADHSYAYVKSADKGDYVDGLPHEVMPFALIDWAEENAVPQEV
jgi:hypothetical protein